jgi:hypothetical protein
MAIYASTIRIAAALLRRLDETRSSDVSSLVLPIILETASHDLK